MFLLSVYTFRCTRASLKIRAIDASVVKVVVFSSQHVKAWTLSDIGHGSFLFFFS